MQFPSCRERVLHFFSLSLPLIRSPDSPARPGHARHLIFATGFVRNGGDKLPCQQRYLLGSVAQFQQQQTTFFTLLGFEIKTEKTLLLL